MIKVRAFRIAMAIGALAALLETAGAPPKWGMSVFGG